ncbi:hypothetical protein HPB50_019519 [Hyalomma asiaticum]|uniref:Uncharacterized protein n=1 Tax=Hyalomma asiaticum TaxID=266040 RepID=A0ACB7T3K7_HYAAI|nr:hypothetical protein HPB50_019519 [Hyalomma asiaticum]
MLLCQRHVNRQFASSCNELAERNGAQIPPPQGRNCSDKEWNLSHGALQRNTLCTDDRIPFHNPLDIDTSFAMDTDTTFSDAMGARIAYQGYTTAEFGLRKLSVDLNPAVKQFFVGICVKLYLDANSKLLNYVGPFRCLLPIVNIGSFSEALHSKHGSGYTSALKCSLLR